MATVKPFAALRPSPPLAAQICELPYDVMSSEEARARAAGNPLSFLRVSKPEIELPDGTDIYAPEVYRKGRDNLDRLMAQGALRQDTGPAFYFYRQIMHGRSQTGLVAAASCQEYLDGVIRKHEFTRPDKEDDRVRHIETLNAQTGPVFLVYRSESNQLASLASKTLTMPPDVDFTATDGVRHSSWTIRDPEQVRWIEAQMALASRLYIADGHHRCAAAARVYRSRIAANPANDTPSRFLSVIFPHDQVQILPYNRALRDLNGHSAPALLEKLDGVFIIHDGGTGTPARAHELGLFLEGRWRTLHFRPRFAATSDAIEKLDVTLLQRFVLDPIFGISDPRTGQRIHFVGGIRGSGELEKRVNSGEFACAFAMHPTRIEDLMAVADSGGIMPPKSTWFEPKLRDAMFCYMLG